MDDSSYTNGASDLILGKESVAHASQEHHGYQDRDHCFGRHVGGDVRAYELCYVLLRRAD